MRISFLIWLASSMQSAGLLGRAKMALNATGILNDGDLTISKKVPEEHAFNLSNEDEKFTVKKICFKSEFQSAFSKDFLSCNRGEDTHLHSFYLKYERFLNTEPEEKAHVSILWRLLLASVVSGKKKADEAISMAKKAVRHMEGKKGGKGSISYANLHFVMFSLLISTGDYAGAREMQKTAGAIFLEESGQPNSYVYKPGVRLALVMISDAILLYPWDNEWIVLVRTACAILVFFGIDVLRCAGMEPLLYALRWKEDKHYAGVVEELFVEKSKNPFHPKYYSPFFETVKRDLIPEGISKGTQEKVPKEIIVGGKGPNLGVFLMKRGTMLSMNALTNENGKLRWYKLKYGESKFTRQNEHGNNESMELETGDPIPYAISSRDEELVFFLGIAPQKIVESGARLHRFGKGLSTATIVANGEQIEIMIDSKHYCSDDWNQLWHVYSNYRYYAIGTSSVRYKEEEEAGKQYSLHLIPCKYDEVFVPKNLGDVEESFAEALDEEHSDEENSDESNTDEDTNAG